MEKPRIFPNKAELISSCVGTTDTVLDIGFWGQGIQHDNPRWPHSLIRSRAKETFGLDLEIDRASFPDTVRYQEGSAEDFSFPGRTFEVLFAGDLIEHLPNPGLFLASCSAHMRETSRLVITTPNCFNLFNIAEKLSKDEPTVNADHTAYFNHKTLRKLLEKCGFEIERIEYVYSLEYEHPESWKKKFLNVIYALVSRFTPKYIETLVVIAKRASRLSETEPQR